MSLNVKETLYIWQHKKRSTAWKASYMATMCTSIFGLPTLVNGFLFVPICGMRTSHIILFCFGDKRCEMVGHQPRIISSAMIYSRFRVSPSTWKLRIVRYWCVALSHPPNKGCVIRDKTMRLTDEYALHSEVRLTSVLYGMISCHVHLCLGAYT